MNLKLLKAALELAELAANDKIEQSGQKELFPGETAVLAAELQDKAADLGKAIFEYRQTLGT